MTIKYMLCNKANKYKPTSINAKDFVIVETSLEDLISHIEKGRAIRPGVLEGGSGDKDWVYQDMIFLDIDDSNINQSLSMCKELDIKPLFIYKSFNYTRSKQKHRIVFKLNKTATNKELLNSAIEALIIKFKADTRCSNSGRVFFGTKYKVESINPNSSVDIEQLAIKLLKDNRIAQTPHGFIEAKNDKLFTTQNAEPVGNSSFEVAKNDSFVGPINNNILYTSIYYLLPQSTTGSSPVMPMDAAIWLEKTLQPKIKKHYESYDAFYRELKQLPLGEILQLQGDYKKQSCIFHEDKKESAGIFVDANGEHVYNCFSCKRSFDLIDVLVEVYAIKEKNKQYSKFKAVLEFAKRNKIKIVQSEWLNSQYFKIRQNRIVLDEMLMDKNIYKKLYPNSTKAIIFSMQVLEVLYTECEKQIGYYPAKDENDNAMFQSSISWIVKKINTVNQASIMSYDKVYRRINRLLEIGAIRAIPDEELKNKYPTLYKKALELKKKNKSKYTINYYALMALDDDLLLKAEERMKEYKDKGATSKGSSARQGIALNNNVRVKARVSKEKTKEQEKMHEWCKRTLKRKNYFTKKSYIEYAKKNKINEDKASTYIAEICVENNLTRIISSKATQKEYKLPKATSKQVVFVKKITLSQK